MNDPLTEFLERQKLVDHLAAGGVYTPAPEAVLPEIEPEPRTPVDVKQTPPVMLIAKLAPVRVFTAQAQNALSDIAVDCRNANAVHVDVVVSGTSPSATVSVEGSVEGGASTQPVADPEGVQAGVSASTSFDVVVGSAWARIRIADISGTYTTGQGFTVTVTPYVNAASQRVLASGRVRYADGSVTRPNDTTPYGADDAIANATSNPSAITISNAARVDGGSGVILGATCLDSAYQTAAAWSLELWLFHTSPTATNDNAAYAPSDADLANRVGVIPFNVWYKGTGTVGTGGNQVSQASGLNIGFKCDTGDRDLYALLVHRGGAITPVAQEQFSFRLVVSQD